MNFQNLTFSGIRYHIYVGQGTVVLVSNLLIILIILRHEILRSKIGYLVIAGLALADSLNGLGTATLGWHRLGVIRDKLVSRRHCFFLPSMQLLIHSSMAQALMLLMVSIDRLLSLTIPLQYLGFGNGYIGILVGAAFTLPLVKWVAGLVAVWNSTEAEVSALCFFPSAMSAEVYHISFVTQISIAGLSTVVYGLVFLRYKHNTAQVASFAYGGNQEQEQKQLTKSLSISCLFTLFLYVIPYILMLLDPYLGIPDVGTVAVILANFNPICNTVIYMKRHKDIRKGLKALVQCKQIQPEPAIPVFHYRSNADVGNKVTVYYSSQGNSRPIIRKMDPELVGHQRHFRQDTGEVQ